MRKIIFYSLLLFMYSCSISYINKDKYLIKNQHTYALNYKIIYKYKPLLKDDTISYTILVMANINTTNNLLYKVMIDSNIYYTFNDTTYLINNKEEYYKIKKRKGYKFVNPVLNSIDNIFVNPNYAYYKENDTIYVVSDEQSSLYKAKLVFNGNKISYLNRIIRYKGYTQFEEFIFSNYEYTNSDIRKELNEIINNYYYKKINHKQVQPFIDTFNIEGYEIHKSKFELKDKKLTLYEFWHRGCGPCLFSIPELNNLQQKYHNDVEIIGVNPIDYDDIDGIKKVISKYDINYKIIVVNNKKINNVFPNYIITNNINEILYQTKGYSTSQIEKIDSIINEYLIKAHNKR